MGIEGSFWRAIAVYRIASLGYAVLLLASAGGFERPLVSWLVAGVMAAWTAIVTLVRPNPVLLTLDVLVTLACMLISPYVQGPGTHAPAGLMPLTATWVAGPVLAWAVYGGRRAGAVSAIVLSLADLWLRGLPGWPLSTPVNGAVLLILAGTVAGHVARLAKDAEERLQRAARREAATRERERLARGIHDSVLQVLALVQRRGLEIGGEAAELGRLAGEQEAALREMVRAGPPADDLDMDRDTRQGGGVSGEVVDVGARLRRLSTPLVTVATPATPLRLPAHQTGEVLAAVGAALDNVARHCGADARAWVFAEDDGARIIVTVRDEGPGFPAGRLAQAEAEGRLGIAQSVRGRIAGLGGTVSITSVPGRGTEVELAVPYGTTVTA
ncbi:MacS family sensor histidine kinase [Nonomuraea maritima]|uniref:MacS family sensor histidine kinase n=1 Tax=Nonomuraea maritima TaxID=683260 RepID=UPI00371176A7